jgi:hypothetical protein
MKRHRHIRKYGVAIAVGLLVAGLAIAQEEDADEDAADEEDVMEEIVVVVDRSGDPVDVDALYLEQMRDQVIKDFNIAQQEQEKEAWRQGLQTSVSNPNSRISWGYDAQSEAAIRRSAMNDLPMDRVQPATVISVSF